MSLAAPPEAVYSDITTVFSTIRAHVKAHAYSLFQRDKKATRVLYTCDRARKYTLKGKILDIHSFRQRKSLSSKKCDCLIRVELCQVKIYINWVLKVPT
jgi:hypothetical protein